MKLLGSICRRYSYRWEISGVSTIDTNTKRHIKLNGQQKKKEKKTLDGGMKITCVWGIIPSNKCRNSNFFGTTLKSQNNIHGEINIIPNATARLCALTNLFKSKLLLKKAKDRLHTWAP